MRDHCKKGGCSEKQKRSIVDAFLKKATDRMQRVVGSNDSVDIPLVNSLLEGAMKTREDQKKEADAKKWTENHIQKRKFDLMSSFTNLSKKSKK